VDEAGVVADVGVGEQDGREVGRRAVGRGEEVEPGELLG